MRVACCLRLNPGCAQVAEAVSQQMFTLNTNSRYLHGNFVSHAEALVATMPPALAVMLATCSGSESNDLALRVATTNNQHGAPPPSRGPPLP